MYKYVSKLLTVVAGSLCLQRMLHVNMKTTDPQKEQYPGFISLNIGFGLLGAAKLPFLSVYFVHFYFLYCGLGQACGISNL